ncbi:MAG: tetratricopeptide repeat protein [Crocinitomicaceae bacterium]|nr:tetratricopeptide repeat protein [Crocinitomicaceae bacterium]
MFINHKHQLAIEALKHADLQKALKLLNEALLENPCHPNILSDRGFLYIHLKKNDLAMEDFDLCVDLQPEYGYRYASRAYAKAYFGATQEAIDDYQKALEIDKNDWVSHQNLGILLQKQGNLAEAENCFKVADEIQGKTEFGIVEKLGEKQQSIDRETIPPSDLMRKQENTISEMKHLFTSKENFDEFMHFLKNGFKAI